MTAARRVIIISRKDGGCLESPRASWKVPALPYEKLVVFKSSLSWAVVFLYFYNAKTIITLIAILCNYNLITVINIYYNWYVVNHFHQIHFFSNTFIE